MKKTVHTFVFLLTISAILAACQAAPATSIDLTGNSQAGSNRSNSALGTGTGTRQFGQNGTSGTFGQGGGNFGGFGRSRTPTVEPSPMPTETPIPTATPVNPADFAVKTVQDYFTAVSSGDYASAVQLFSAFSLRVAQLTAGDAQAVLAQQMQADGQWSNLVVKDSQVLDTQTILVHVTYQVAAIDAKTGNAVQQARDELWPVRLEAGKWLYNYANVIDYHTLTAPPQTVAGLTVLPTQLTRYSDKLVLSVLAQNNTNDAIVIGNQNQVLATFHFDDKTVDSANTRYIIDRLRGYPNLQIVVNGLYQTYPDSVDIVKYTNLTVKPWFTFSLK